MKMLIYMFVTLYPTHSYSYKYAPTDFAPPANVYIQPYVRPYIGTHIHPRWCDWKKDCVHTCGALQSQM